jgi:hypothetical protein
MATVQETKLAADISVKRLDLSPRLEKQDSAFLEGDATTAPSQTEDKYENLVSTEYSVEDSANGDAAALQKYGPPKPICNEARMANLKELGLNKKPIKDPQIRESHTPYPSFGSKLLPIQTFFHPPDAIRYFDIVRGAVLDPSDLRSRKVASDENSRESRGPSDLAFLNCPLQTALSPTASLDLRRDQEGCKS